MKHLFTSTANSLSRYTRRGALLLALGAAAGPAAWGQSFGPVMSYQTLSRVGPYGLALGDLNGDGRLDAVVANGAGNDVSVFLAVAGGFAAPQRYSVGLTGQPWGVAVADVNSDGRLDIITANNMSGSVGVLVGQASGFAPVVVYPIASNTYDSPIGVAVGDVNGDGRQDIVVGNHGPSNVVVMLGLAGGGFAASASYSAGPMSGPYGVALADLNNDGRLDVVSANNYSNTVGVLLGLAGGGFAPAATYATSTAGTNPGPLSVAVGDVNRDGRLDIVTANYLTGTVGVLLGLASGFSPVSLYPVGTGAGVQDAELGDVNGDGLLDIVAARGGSAYVLLGRTTGGFASAVAFSTGFNDPFNIALADLNQDGRLDIASSCHYYTSLAVLLNTGTYTPLAARPAAAADVALAPNPAHEAFAVTLPAGTAATHAELLNALGQVVRRPAVAGSHFAVETAGLAPGVYSLRLSTGTGTVAKRVVVQ